MNATLTLDRKKLIQAVRKLPEACSLEDAIYHLQVWAALQESEESLRQHGGIPHEQVVAHFRRKWAKKPTR